jgi:hypothetical protein
MRPVGFFHDSEKRVASAFAEPRRKRLEEVLAVQPYAFVTALELGNAYIRLGRTDDALRAYRTPLAHLDRGIMDDATRALLEAQIARLARGEPVDVLRNPWLE